MAVFLIVVLLAATVSDIHARHAKRMPRWLVRVYLSPTANGAALMACSFLVVFAVPYPSAIAVAISGLNLVRFLTYASAHRKVYITEVENAIARCSGRG